MSGAGAVLMRTGVGKAFAAMVAQRAIDRVRPDYLIVTGIAGSVRDGLQPGDVVVGRDCVQHDLDATALGFELGRVPYTEHRILRADPRLVELALAVPVAGRRVVAGRILTGISSSAIPMPRCAHGCAVWTATWWRWRARRSRWWRPSTACRS